MALLLVNSHLMKLVVWMLKSRRAKSASWLDHHLKETMNGQVSGLHHYDRTVEYQVAEEGVGVYGACGQGHGQGVASGIQCHELLP